jgi:hypothetical protein
MLFAVHYREDAPVQMALGALGLLILAVVLTFLFQSFDHAAYRFGGALAWVLAGLALAALGKAMLLMRDNRPAVRLGPEGISDRRWSPKPINWLNIAEFDPLRHFGVWVVQLRLKDPEADPPATWAARLARNFGLVPPDAVLVLVPGLDCTAEALSERILEIGTAAIEAAEEAAEWAQGSEYAAPPNG